MQTAFTYSHPRWQALSAQAITRDGHRCTVSRLLGGDCSPLLHVHHLIPVSEDPSRAHDLDNVVTTCARHHPSLEALRRYVMRYQRPRCRHYHPYPQGREACERRLSRQAAYTAA